MRMSVINNEVFLETPSEILSEGTRMAAQGFSLTVGRMQMNGHRCQDPALLLPPSQVRINITRFAGREKADRVIYPLR